MIEGVLSWRRALLWPYFEVGPQKGLPRNFFSFLFLLIAGHCIYRLAFHHEIAYAFSLGIAYLMYGFIWWIVLQGTRLWERLLSAFPRFAHLCSILSYLFVWEVRVLLTRNPPRWLRVWWMIICTTTAIAYALIYINHLDNPLGYLLLAGVKTVSTATGVALACREWYLVRTGHSIQPVRS